MIKPTIREECKNFSFLLGKLNRNKYNIMKKGTKIWISIGVFVLLFIMCGFNTRQSTIESYSTEFSTYVLAEYSDLVTGVDHEGNFYSNTDYWKEQVSETWSISTVKGSVVKYSCPIDLIVGYTCKTPEITIQHPKGYNFDRYTKVRDIEYYVDYGDGDFSTVNTKEYKAAIAKIGKGVTVKTWYGSAYGFAID